MMKRVSIAGAAFTFLGCCSLLGAAVLALDEYRSLHNPDTFSVNFDGYGWPLVIAAALVGLCFLALAAVTYTVRRDANGRE